MSLLGYQQMGVLMLTEAMEAEKEAEHKRKKQEQAKASAYAHVCHSYGVSPKNMTVSQRAMSEAVSRKWGGAQTTNRYSGNRGFGFSIPTAGRKP